MNKATPPSVNKAPEFSKLHAVKDGVLVCTQKDGADERFRYVPLNQVILENGMTLGQYMESTDAKIKDLEDKLQAAIDADIAWKTKTNELLETLIQEIQKGE